MYSSRKLYIKGSFHSRTFLMTIIQCRISTVCFSILDIIITYSNCMMILRIFGRRKDTYFKMQAKFTELRNRGFMFVRKICTLICEHACLNSLLCSFNVSCICVSFKMFVPLLSCEKYKIGCEF